MTAKKQSKKPAAKKVVNARNNAPLALHFALREKLLNRYFFSKMRGDLRPDGCWWAGHGTFMQYVFVHYPEADGKPTGTKPPFKAMLYAVGKLPDLKVARSVKTLVQSKVPNFGYYAIEVRPSKELLGICENDMRQGNRREKRAQVKAERKAAEPKGKSPRHFKNTKVQLERVGPKGDMDTALTEPTIFHKIARLNQVDRLPEVIHLTKAAKHPMDLDKKDKAGWTALHYAARWAGSPMVFKLLGYGADPKLKTKGGLTVLHCAAMNGDTEGPVTTLKAQEGKLFKHLLGVRDREGRTPLHWAAATENLRVVQALVDAGADRKAKDKKGHMPKQFVPAENIAIMSLLGRRTK